MFCCVETIVLNNENVSLFNEDTLSSANAKKFICFFLMNSNRSLQHLKKQNYYVIIQYELNNFVIIDGYGLKYWIRSTSCCNPFSTQQRWSVGNKDIIYYTWTSNEGLAKGSPPNVEHKAPLPKI